MIDQRPPWPLLLTVAGGLLSGAAAAFDRANGTPDALAAMLGAAGLVILGAWLAMESAAWSHRRRDPDPPGDPGSLDDPGP